MLKTKIQYPSEKILTIEYCSVDSSQYCFILLRVELYNRKKKQEKSRRVIFEIYFTARGIVKMTKNGLRSTVEGKQEE